MTFLNKIIDKAKSHQHSNHSSVSSTASTQQSSTTSSKELHNTQSNNQLPSDQLSNNQLPEEQKQQPEMTPSSSEATRMSVDNSTGTPEKPRTTHTRTVPSSTYTHVYNDKNIIQQRQNRPKLKLADFHVLRTLGTGSFGRVHLVQSRVNARYYAIKVLKKSEVVRLKQVAHSNNEKHILESVAHPFLVNMWGTFQDDVNLYMVMDYVPGGELFSVLRRSQRFPDHVAKFYAAEVVLAIEYLHSKDVIYRDLKPETCCWMPMDISVSLILVLPNMYLILLGHFVVLQTTWHQRLFNPKAMAKLQIGGAWVFLFLKCLQDILLSMTRIMSSYTRRSYTAESDGHSTLILMQGIC